MLLGSNECDVSYQYGTRASFHFIRRIPALYILRPKKPIGSWNLVNPLLRMNEAWMDECAARLQPLVDQYKPIQHETFTIEKFRDLIVTTRSCPGDKKIFFKKEIENIPVSLNKIIKIKCVMNQNLAQPYTDIG